MVPAVLGLAQAPVRERELVVSPAALAVVVPVPVTDSGRRKVEPAGLVLPQRRPP